MAHEKKHVRAGNQFKTDYRENETFKPEIGKESRMMAERKLSNNPNMSVGDRLYKQKQEQEAKRMQKRQAMLEAEAARHVHKPEMTEESRRLAVSKSVTLAGAAAAALSGRKFSKWDMLHMESQKKQDKTDVSADEIAMAKEPGEYTFQP